MPSPTPGARVVQEVADGLYLVLGPQGADGPPPREFLLADNPYSPGGRVVVLRRETVP